MSDKLTCASKFSRLQTLLGGSFRHKEFICMGYYLEVEYNSFWQAQRRLCWPYESTYAAQHKVCLDISLHMYHGLKKICCCWKLKKVITTEILFQFYFYSQYIISMIYNLSTNNSFITFFGSGLERKRKYTGVKFVSRSV